MTDEEFAAECNISVEAAQRMKPEHRATYEHLINVGRELELWAIGLGPKPKGVIACRGGKEIKHAR